MSISGTSSTLQKYRDTSELTACPQVYKGRNEILLSNLILDPAHSILTQSYDSRLRLVCWASTCTLPRDE